MRREGITERITPIVICAAILLAPLQLWGLDFIFKAMVWIVTWTFVILVPLGAAAYLIHLLLKFIRRFT